MCYHTYLIGAIVVISAVFERPLLTQLFVEWWDVEDVLRVKACGIDDRNVTIRNPARGFLGGEAYNP